MVHGEYATRAPLLDKAYVAPRIKDDAVAGLKSERILSVDAGYVWELPPLPRKRDGILDRSVRPD